MLPKLIKRLKVIGWNAFRQFLLVFGNALVAYLVIQQSSDEVWGAFVEDLIFVGLSVHLAAWGNKEYLLRAFSNKPSGIALEFYRALWPRLILLTGPIVVSMFLYTGPSLFYILLWILANFLYQAFDVLVVYRRMFAKAALADFVGLFIIIIGLVLFYKDLKRQDLVFLFALSYLIRTLLMTILIRLPAFHFHFNTDFLLKALPFFLIGLSGLLQSKTDLYAVNFMLDDQQTGQYQIIISFFIFVQAVAGFILMPYAKNLFRLPVSAIRKLVLVMTGAGFLIILLSMPFIYWALHQLYGFNLSLDYFLFGAFFIIPTFIYLPLLFLLYRENREKKVMWINFFGAGVNLIFTISLIPILGNKGALLGSAIAQWVLLFIYFSHFRKLFFPNANSLSQVP